jgi:hypothetical protein
MLVLRATARTESRAAERKTDLVTPVQLKHLLAVVDGSPFDGRISDSELVLEADRR